MKYEFLLKEKGDKNKVGSSFLLPLPYLKKEKREESEAKAFGLLNEEEVSKFC